MRSVLRDKDHLIFDRKKAAQHSRSRMSLCTIEEENKQKNGERTTRRKDNKTELIRLIEAQHYAAAIQRLYQYPKEVYVSTAVAAGHGHPHGKLSFFSKSNCDPVAARVYEPSNTPHGMSRVSTSVNECILIRQLPLHIACGNLAREDDTTSSARKAQLESLIRHMVSLHPKSCLKRDLHGQLPLHQAVIHKASVETIMSMLCAAPSTLHEVDQSHRTPVELNQLSSGGDQTNQRRSKAVHLMLTREQLFWEQARQEAVFRLKNRNIPLEGASIGSMSVLASSFSDGDDASTIVTKSTSNTFGSSGRSVPIGTTSRRGIAQMKTVDMNALSQLEKRVNELEQRLVESCDKNHDLEVVVSQLQVALKQTKAKYQLLAETDLAQRVLALERENDHLKTQNRELHDALQKHSRNTASCPTTGTDQERNVEDSLKPLDNLCTENKEKNTDASLQKQRDDLQSQVKELRDSNKRYEEQFAVFQGLLENAEDIMPGSPWIDDNGASRNIDPRDNDQDLDEVDSIILHAEQLYGCRLRKELVEAWKVVSLDEDLNNQEVGSEISDLDFNEDRCS